MATSSDTAIHVENERDSVKRSYSSPLQADTTKKAMVSTPTDNDDSYHDFMASLGEPGTAFPTTTANIQPQQLPPVEHHAYQQWQYHQLRPASHFNPLSGTQLSSYQHGSLGGTGTYIHNQPRSMVPQYFQQPAMTTYYSQDPRNSPFQVSTHTTSTSVVFSTNTPISASAPTYIQSHPPTPVTTDNFPALLASAFQNPQVRESLGSLITDRLEQVTEDLERRIRELEAKNLSLEVTNTQLHTRVERAESAIDELEQYGRRNALRISNNLPEVPGEDTDKIVLELANTHLGVQLEASDISRSHRVGPPSPSKPRQILVKFATYRAREKVFKARSKLKGTSLGYFLNEDLTKKRGHLAFLARMMKRDKKIADTWTYDCRVFIKTNHGTTKTVNSVHELEHFAS